MGGAVYAEAEVRPTPCAPTVPVVLVATREPGSAWALELRRRGHAATLSAEADEACRLSDLLGGSPVLVGEGFHEMSAAEVVRALRASGSGPVLALTCGGEGARIEALVHAGADDVLSRRDDPARVSARLCALARLGAREGAIERLAGLELDPRRRTLTVGDTAVQLRPREFGLLMHLVHAAGRIVPFGELRDTQGPAPTAGDSALRSGMYRLRKAITEHPGLGLEIETIRSRGYRLRGAGAGAP